MRRAGASQLDDDFSFQVRQNSAGPAAHRFGPIDPQHGLLTACDLIALRDFAHITQYLNLVRALSPPIGLSGVDRNRLALTRRGKLNV
jgi:hypothetical protein